MPRFRLTKKAAITATKALMYGVEGAATLMSAGAHALRKQAELEERRVREQEAEIYFAKDVEDYVASATPAKLVNDELPLHLAEAQIDGQIGFTADGGTYPNLSLSRDITDTFRRSN